MTCVWRAETAACRKARIADRLPGNTGPHEEECRSGCPNLAFTDRDIARRTDLLRTLDLHAGDALAPWPLRDRAAAQADQLRDTVATHERSKTTAPTATEGARL